MPHLGRLDARSLAGGQLGSWRHPYGLPPSHITGPTCRGRGCGAGLPSSSVARGDGCYRYGSGRDSVHFWGRVAAEVPPEREQSFGGGGGTRDPGTDLEDELSIPASPPAAC